MKRLSHPRVPVAGREGFSFIEVLIAAMLLLIVFFGLAQLYARGRKQIDYEEDRRSATAVAQARLDALRRDYHYNSLSSQNGAANDTTYYVEGRPYTVHHLITPESPDSFAATVQVTVTWRAQTATGTINRTLNTTTVLARGLQWPD
jgi:Tfp pilus assembly protein PilV